MSALFNDIHETTLSTIAEVSPRMLEVLMRHLRPEVTPEPVTPEQREAERDAACYGLEWEVQSTSSTEGPDTTECGQTIPDWAFY
tara:strand:+ start:214 stop:468 length:255 start_codon:yes stop_codon:yes gene_type:complete